METKTNIKIEELTQNKVSIIKENYIEVEGQRYNGEISRNIYVNCQSDRDTLKNKLNEEYYNAIMAVWGETPTITIDTEGE
jgi:predicted methyltransferase